MSVFDCLAGEIQHITPGACSEVINWKEVERIFYKKTDGAQFVSAADSTAYQTFIETESNWDTGIGEADPNNLAGTSKISQFNTPKTVPTEVTTPNQKLIPTGFKPPIKSEVQFSGVPSDEEVKLRLIHGRPLDFVLLMNTGELITKPYVDASTDIWFRAYATTVTNMERLSGANLDNMQLDLYTEENAFVNWAVFSTTFLLTK